MVAHPAGAGMKRDPGQFPVPKAVIESFESLEFLDDLVRDPPPPAYWEDLERLREQAQHALRLKAALEGADRFGVGVGFLGPLAGGTLLQEDQWADEFIALLHYVVEGAVGGCQRLHIAPQRRPPGCGPGGERPEAAWSIGPPRVTLPRGTRCSQRRRAGRYENDRGCEGAYCSEAGDRTRALPTWGLASSRPH